MPTDIDIWRSARLLIDQHGDDAPIHAAMRADQMLDAGNLEGKRVWLRIKDAIEQMLSETPAGRVH